MRQTKPLGGTHWGPKDGNRRNCYDQSLVGGCDDELVSRLRKVTESLRCHVIKHPRAFQGSKGFFFVFFFLFFVIPALSIGGKRSINTRFSAQSTSTTMTRSANLQVALWFQVPLESEVCMLCYLPA
ncbi:hypothetical protein ACKS0A_04882 [Histoplasma ohiense]